VEDLNIKENNMVRNIEKTGPMIADPNISTAVETELNDLITMNRGIIEVYQTAAERLENEINIKLLDEYAEQHKTFVIELTNCVVKYSGSPSTTANGGSMVKQAWVTLKAAFTDGDGPILAEVVQDAQSVMDAYAEAIGSDMPDDVRKILRKHMSATRLAFDKLSALSAVVNN